MTAGDDGEKAEAAVRCLTHGPMKYRPELGWWECLGFDGEGPRDCGVMILYVEDLKYAVSIPGVQVMTRPPEG